MNLQVQDSECPFSLHSPLSYPQAFQIQCVLTLKYHPKSSQYLLIHAIYTWDLKQELQNIQTLQEQVKHVLSYFQFEHVQLFLMKSLNPLQELVETHLSEY